MELTNYIKALLLILSTIYLKGVNGESGGSLVLSD